MFNDPAQVLQLQVGDAHVTDYAFSLEFVQGGQCLVDHLLQSAFHAALELNVMYINNIDVVNVQTLQALVDALLGAAGGEFFTRNILQCLTQYDFSLIVAVIRRYIDDVNPRIYCSENGINTTILIERVEHTTQRRGAEAQLRHLYSSFA